MAHRSCAAAQQLRRADQGTRGRRHRRIEKGIPYRVTLRGCRRAIAFVAVEARVERRPRPSGWAGQARWRAGDDDGIDGHAAAAKRAHAVRRVGEIAIVPVESFASALATCPHYTAVTIEQEVWERKMLI